MYWLPEELFTDTALLNMFMSCIPSANGWYGKFLDIEGTGKKQIVLEKPQGYQNLNYVQGDYEIEVQLKDLAAAGADKALLKLPGCQEWMSLELCRIFNDKIHQHAVDSKGKLIPLAAVPPDGTKESTAELIRCHDELGMTAVQLSAHYGDKYLDDDSFSGFFRVLNDLGMTAYIHHTPVPVEYNTLYEYNNLRRSYGRCADQEIAIGREIFSGFFNKYPKVKFVHSMLGGGFFAIANMMFPNPPKTKETVSRFRTENENARSQFKEHIYFELSHAQPWGRAQLECAVEVLGADHLIFGSSYPVRREWLTEGPAFIKNLDISDQQKELILSGNAIALYRLG
jgi:predicted TIM-barrel fold metal-dependent hydrolase